MNLQCKHCAGPHINFTTRLLTCLHSFQSLAGSYNAELALTCAPIVNIESLLQVLSQDVNQKAKSDAKEEELQHIRTVKDGVTLKGNPKDSDLRNTTLWRLGFEIDGFNGFDLLPNVYLGISENQKAANHSSPSLYNAKGESPNGEAFGKRAVLKESDPDNVALWRLAFEIRGADRSNSAAKDKESAPKSYTAAKLFLPDAGESVSSADWSDGITQQFKRVLGLPPIRSDIRLLYYGLLMARHCRVEECSEDEPVLPRPLEDMPQNWEFLTKDRVAKSFAIQKAISRTLFDCITFADLAAIENTWNWVYLTGADESLQGLVSSEVWFCRNNGRTLHKFVKRIKFIRKKPIIMKQRRSFPQATIPIPRRLCIPKSSASSDGGCALPRPVQEMDRGSRMVEKDGLDWKRSIKRPRSLASPDMSVARAEVSRQSDGQEDLDMQVNIKKEEYSCGSRLSITDSPQFILQAYESSQPLQCPPPPESSSVAHIPVPGDAAAHVDTAQITPSFRERSSSTQIKPENTVTNEAVERRPFQKMIEDRIEEIRRRRAQGAKLARLNADKETILKTSELWKDNASHPVAETARAMLKNLEMEISDFVIE